MFRVFTTNFFEESIKDFSKQQRERIFNFYKKIRTGDGGKPLRYKFLREKRIAEKRVYFLIYTDLKIVLFVAASDKKAQQETIDFIITHLDEFQIKAKELSNSFDSASL